MTVPAGLFASVVMATYNKARYLELTLASFLSQSTARYELVIVDDGSTDATADVVARYVDRLPIVYIKQDNQGRSAARNAGVATCRGEVVIFSDDDRVVPATFVAEHVHSFRSTDDHLLLLGRQRALLTWWLPDLAADDRLAGLFKRRTELPSCLPADRAYPLVTASDIRQRFAETLDSYAFEEPWWETYCVPVITAYPDLSAYRLAWTLATTGNMSVARELLARVGPFDERFQWWGLEDTELCYRLFRAGARIDVNTEAVSYHQVHASSPTKLDEWNRNFRHFAGKFDHAIELLLYLFISKKWIGFAAANDVLDECESLRRVGRTLVVDELALRYRELAATLLAGSSGEDCR